MERRKPTIWRNKPWWGIGECPQAMMQGINMDTSCLLRLFPIACLLNMGIAIDHTVMIYLLC